MYKGKNLDPLPPTDVTDPESDLSQIVTDIASNVQLIVYYYKVLKEKLIRLWEN